jgi:hypothetical protein
MRLLLFALVPLSILGGCRGYLADHVRPETGIIAPELTRYGLGAGQSQCISERLAKDLSVWQLRQLVNVTSLIKDASRLNPGELLWVSGHVKDPKVAPAVKQAAEGCALNVAAATAAAGAATATATVEADAPAAATIPSENSTAADAPPATASTTAPPAATAPASSRWLNLGAGIDKRAISIDASTLQGEMPVRSAWFRIIAPGATATVNSYLLQIDCTAKTVNPLASRKHDAKGAVTEEVQHGANGAGANPIQGGSVIEIAYLSLCT